jgi:hypothetical protein
VGGHRELKELREFREFRGSRAEQEVLASFKGAGRLENLGV